MTDTSSATDGAPQQAIFISYRRDDTSGHTGWLYDSLRDHFGAPRLFRDIDAIAPGANFVDAIQESVLGCGALLAIIGREWPDCTNPDGGRRLDDPEDFVRLEIASALEHGVAIIPVLVEGAHMPSSRDLPEPLTELAQLNALEISDSRFDYDVGRLIERLDALVGAPPTAPQGWRPRLRRAMTPWRAIALAILVAAAVVGGALVLPGDGSPSVRPMTGDFNIAVAGFGNLDAQGQATDSPDGLALAQSVHDQLSNALETLGDSGFDVQLRPPEETGVLKGSTREARADAAEATARRIRADVIVYGTLEASVPGRFTPEFFLSEGKLENAEELLGQHELGTSIEIAGDITRNPVARKTLRDQLLGRTQATAEFVVGLSHYALGQFQPALDRFKTAEDADGWDDRDGKEVLYLFLGNAALKLDQLDEAAQQYNRALELNPEYSRAQVGAAEVVFHRSRDNCEAGGVDRDGLTRTVDMFNGALSARLQPALSDIPTKVSFGEGRAHLCLSQAQVADHWADARREFDQVVAEFDKGNKRVTDMAAEAHANLGFIDLPAAGDADAADRYRRAATEYQRAAEITRQQDRKAFFFSMLGFISGRLGETAKAEQAYREAIRLAPDDATRTRYEESRRQLQPR
ncbi:MAG: tetratricopeptide repeat protein [Acidimicrobiales bacterium]